MLVATVRGVEQSLKLQRALDIWRKCRLRLYMPLNIQNLGNRKEIEESDEMEVKKRKVITCAPESSSQQFGLENEKNQAVKFSLSDVKNKYKDASLPPNWKAFQTIIFNDREEGLHDTEKIAAFDFDGCLANTSVRRTGADAWALMYPSIPEKLQELYNGGHKLVIFTNESNIDRWKNKRQQAVDSKLGRLDNFIKLAKVPIQVFVACGVANNKTTIDDPFRKPMTGMWKIFAKYFNSGITIDMNKSFFVGDAAGRAKDHSDADIKFAQKMKHACFHSYCHVCSEDYNFSHPSSTISLSDTGYTHAHTPTQVTTHKPA